MTPPESPESPRSRGARILRWRPIAIVAGALAIVTAVIASLEAVGINDASAVYLLAVVGVAVLIGTTPAIATAIAAFLLFDFLFVEPRFTLTVNDPREWLDLLLLLVIGLVVGRLAGRERDRAETAVAREREARALFKVSFALAGATETRAALPAIVDIIRADTAVERVWIVVGDAVVADSDGSGDPPRPAVHAVLGRRPGDQPAEWTRVHAPGGSKGRTDVESRDRGGASAFRVAIASGERTLGSVWATRPRQAGPPDPGDTRVLATAADQVAGSLVRDRLRGDATAAEIARRSDALKSALLDSVSHDLRTPLAAIRAAAGTLMDPAVEWPPDERREIARSIDRDATWLGRLVTNLLDMSRLEAGELRADPQVFALDDLVADAIARGGATIGPDRIAVEIPDELPLIRVDEVFLGQVLANVLDNAAKYAGPAVPIRVTATRSGEDRVRVTVEDGGTGVPDASLDRLFEKFYRVPRASEGSRRGTGIGLAVVRGLMEAMGGGASASQSQLGGLAVMLDVPVAPSLAESIGAVSG